jgi:hypothetical protein
MGSMGKGHSYLIHLVYSNQGSRELEMSCRGCVVRSEKTSALLKERERKRAGS